MGFKTMSRLASLVLTWADQDFIADSPIRIIAVTSQVAAMVVTFSFL